MRSDYFLERGGVMLYHLLYEFLYPLGAYWSPLKAFNVIQYVTFRTAGATLTALLISLLLGPWLIRRLQEFQIGQHIREEGPKSHQAKAGTPTMGGVLIVVSILLPTLLWANLRNPFVWLVVLSTLAYAGNRLRRRLSEDSSQAKSRADRGARRSRCSSWSVFSSALSCCIWPIATCIRRR